MHCVVSWDISEGVPARSTLEQKMLTVLQPHSWIRPLTTFYIVQVAGQIAYNSMIAQLISVAQQHPNRINVVVTPLMSGGQYNGLLPGNLWPEIANRAF
jgi:hypothetical protein